MIKAIYQFMIVLYGQSMAIKLRHYQAGVTPALSKYLIKNKGKHPLVALPTGSGKTYCIADFVKYARNHWKVPVVIISHVKEILEQNHASLSKYLDEPVGLNSAGLGRREYEPITVAGIQSVFREPQRFGKQVIVVVDEAHLISPNEDTMYRKFFDGLDKFICVGFTATPFRLGDGYIYGAGHLFDDLVYDWTDANRFQQLVDEGYLAHLTTKRTALEMDTTGIKLTGGDFNDKALSDAFDRKAITERAIKEILAAGKLRKKWLVFAIDINHAEHIAETLIRNGIPTAPVHSKMANSGFSREKSLEGFKDGKYRCVVNVNILTTGFDEPGIDLIAMLRPTQSPVLHVQSLGRGSRVHADKENCLVLDFAGNTARLGPINNVLVRVAGKGKGGGEPIMKDCPKCAEMCMVAVKHCPECGHEFQFKHGLSYTPFDDSVLEDGKVHWATVDGVSYETITSFGSPSMAKVIYHCGSTEISEVVCVEHRGFSKHRADHWVKYRGGEKCNLVADLIAQSDSLRVPEKILVQKKGRYKTVNDARFAD